LVLAILGFALAPNWGVAIALALATGVGNSVLNAYAISIVMTRSPKEMLGRVMAAIDAIIQSGSVIGIVLSGIAISFFHVRPVLLVCGILSAIILAIFAPDVIRYGRSFKEDKVGGQ
jgi:MFS family permease